MDKNILNNLLSNVDVLQTRLKAYNSFRKEYCKKNKSAVSSEIAFRDESGELLASFTLDPSDSHEVLLLLIERTKTKLEATAETIKNMITEEET